LGLAVLAMGLGCLLWLRGLSLGVWDLAVAMVVVLPDLTFAVGELDEEEEEEEEEEAVVDFLVCNGGLVAVVLIFALLMTDGALACLDSLAGRALELVLTLGLLPAAAVAQALPDETTPPTCCFDCPSSGLVLRSLEPKSTPELSLSAFRRAGFFLGFLAALGFEGG
jgi:hypothetical protein